MTIYGDYYNAETRAVLCVLKISGINHDYINLNTLQNEHRDSQKYLQVNPTGLVPTLVDGSYKILNGNNIQLQYLCDTYNQTRNLLCPE